jgi:hypothetical protein
MARRRIDELDSPLNTSQELEGYCKKARDLCRDIFLEFSFAADELQQNLSTLPTSALRFSNGPAGAANSRLRARKVARHLRKAAEAQKYAGVQVVRCWREFTRAFAPEIEARRRPGGGNRRRFDI